MASEMLDRDPILEMFLFESAQLIEQLEEQLLDIERSHQLSSAHVDTIFRIMHTIKGSSAMMEFDALALLAHALEDLFEKYRSQPDTVVNGGQLVDLVLKAVDFCKGEIANIERGEALGNRPDELIDQIKGFFSSLNGSEGVLEICQAKGHYLARLWFEPGCEMENLRAFTAIHSLMPLTEELDYIPADIADNEESSSQIREQGFFIRFSSSADMDLLQNTLEQTLFLDRLELAVTDRSTWLKSRMEGATSSDRAAACPDDHQMDLLSGAASPSALERKSSTPDVIEKSATGNSMISVPVRKLDQLMDLVGELVISEAMVIKNPELEELELPSFQKAARQLFKLTNELQDLAMSIRMVPVAATFQKMQRIVRDMNRKLGKDVELQLSGEETEVDKSIIDTLSDPLMHLIRNALDHGIEAPDERAAAGKPARGLLELSARSAGGDVWITIQDDGRGLDRDRILAKARSRNLLTKPEHEYSDREIFQFILLPGFSTKEVVTEFSGRGVGMDVVREKISRIGGLINLDSNPGQGTTISIRIPLTLAIINGMQISVGDSNYIVPITSIRESFRVDEQKILQDPDGNEMVMLRGECCNVVRLHRKYEVQTGIEELAHGILVVVEDEDRSYCLFADRLVGEQQVVVKPLPTYLKKSEGLAGCTILGDGSISLILDVAGLVAS